MKQIFVFGSLGRSGYYPGRYTVEYIKALAESFYGTIVAAQGRPEFASDDYREYIRLGGGHGMQGLVGTRSNARVAIRELKGKRARTNREKLSAIFAKPAKAAEMLNNIIDMSNRLAEYKRAKDIGDAGITAFHKAQDITLDFFQSGTWAPFIKPFVLFFNAGAQD
jgi:hypothetical protein